MVKIIKNKKIKINKSKEEDKKNISNNRNEK
jgi:hypothetical protein